MKINPATRITFGYKHMLKTYWLEGKLPTVIYGIYGGELTKDNVTLEHLKPHSKGGATKLCNLAVKIPFFNGDEYIRQISKTIEKLLKNGK